MHWIAHFITFDRVPSTNLDDTKPLVADPDNFENINYLMGKNGMEKLRQDYIILVARVLAEFFSIHGNICSCNSQAHTTQVLKLPYSNAIL